MTGANTLSPIQAYFAQGLRGRSTWQYWAFGLFFAGLIFAVLQVPSVVLFLAGLSTMGPEALQEFASSAETPDPASAGRGMLIFVAAIIASIASITFFFIGAARKPEAKNLVTIGAVLAIIATAAGIYLMASGGGDEATNDMLAEGIRQSPLVYLALLISFPPMIMGLCASVKWVHKRSIKSLMTAHTKFRWGRLFQTMIVFWAIAGALGLITHLLGWSEFEYVFNPSRFAMYAVISLLFIPLQSAAEEILLRGYLNQGLGKYIKNPWIVFFITSAGFAALHLGNPEALKGAENGTLLLTMSSYFAFGFIACILTYMDGGLESAIGMHVANNLFASTIMGYDDSVLPTPTVFNTTLDPAKDMITLVLSMSLMLFILWKIRKPLVPDLPSLADTMDDKSEVFS